MTSKTDASWTSISKIVALTLCLIAAGLIFCGHAVHVLGVLPYLFLLAC